jgi:hypothetical protein
MKKLNVVRADCWTALYADGVLVEQHHEIDWPTALKSCGFDVEVTWAQEQADAEGSFPGLMERVRPDIW